MLENFATVKYFYANMSVHDKTSKWISNCVKREKSKRNKHVPKQQKAGDKDVNEHLPAHMSQCSYCTKVFFDAKFLVKHILRRHCDKLIELHKNAVPNTKSEKNYEMPDLFEFLRAEFSNLKIEVDDLKKALENHLQERKGDVFERSGDYKSSIDKKDSTINSIPVGTKSDSCKSKQSEDSYKICSDHIHAADFQNLQLQVDKLFQMFKETVVSKEDVEKTIALNEEKIYKSLKDELLTEIHDILSNHQKKNEEYQMLYKELKKEIDKLEKTVQLVSKRNEMPECSQEIQSNFESRIKNLLTGHSLFASSAKRKKMDKSKNLCNEQKLSVPNPKRRTKSIYTSKTVFNKSSDLSGNCKDGGSNSALCRRRKQTSFESNSQINQETPLFSAKNNQLKMREKKELCEFNSLTDNSENFTEKHLKEVELIIKEKFKGLNIDPSGEKIPNEEFEKKMRLVKSEKEFLQKKYKNFSQVRDELNNHVNKLVKSKSKRKLHKKLRFSNSLELPAPDCNSVLQTHRTAQKQESSGFVVPSDLNAQGDFSPKTVEVENSLPLQENYGHEQDGSYSDYPLHSSTHLQNDYESFRRYIPASPVGYVMKSSVSKLSTDSLLQKSVEEMSDLSSLESVILEDECDNLKGSI